MALNLLIKNNACDKEKHLKNSIRNAEVDKNKDFSKLEEYKQEFTCCSLLFCWPMPSYQGRR